MRVRFLAMSLDYLAQVVEEPRQVLEELAAKSDRPERLRAVALEVAGRQASSDDRTGDRSRLSAMECEVWFLALLEHVGTLVGEVDCETPPRGSGLSVDEQLRAIGARLEDLSRDWEKVVAFTNFVCQVLERRCGIDRLDFTLRERTIGGLRYDVMALRPARIGGLDRSEIAGILARPEFGLPWDPYEEAAVSYYDPSGGEWFTE